MKKVVVTGDRPTGKLHLGHYVGSLNNRLILQKTKQTQSYIMIADQQALTDHAATPEKVSENVLEVALDYLAVGIDPKKSTIFIQSQIPELAEITMYYMNLVSVARVGRNPTVKHEIQEKSFGQSIPTGFFVYPISQAADITAFRATHVPVGEDQLPMLEQTREIVREFHHLYRQDVLVEPEIILPKANARRLVGIDGKGKMSKSLNNGIYLADTEEEIERKVMSMYTDPNHIHIEDPGKIEGNVVFTYLDVFATDTVKVDELKEQYQHGGLGDVLIKKYLNQILQEFLAPIRSRREYYAQKPDLVMQMLREGSKKARVPAKQTLYDVKKAMGIQYFD